MKPLEELLIHIEHFRLDFPGKTVVEDLSDLHTGVSRCVIVARDGWSYF